MLTWTTWDWLPCECFLEETTLARAGWGKSPCPVRRGRGESRSLASRPFIPCSPLYSTGSCSKRDCVDSPTGAWAGSSLNRRQRRERREIAVAMAVGRAQLGRSQQYTPGSWPDGQPRITRITRMPEAWCEDRVIGGNRRKNKKEAKKRTLGRGAWRVRVLSAVDRLRNPTVHRPKIPGSHRPRVSFTHPPSPCRALRSLGEGGVLPSYRSLLTVRTCFNR